MNQRFYKSAARMQIFEVSFLCDGYADGYRRCYYDTRSKARNGLLGFKSAHAAETKAAHAAETKTSTDGTIEISHRPAPPKYDPTHGCIRKLEFGGVLRDIVLQALRYPASYLTKGEVRANTLSVLPSRHPRTGTETAMG